MEKYQPEGRQLASGLPYQACHRPLLCGMHRSIRPFAARVDAGLT